MSQAHILIVGRTLSGKSTLAKGLARGYKDAGRGVIVLDILKDPEWSADFITDDPDEFLKVLWDSRECMCFIDEAGESVGRYNEAMAKTATRGRHWGHVMHYITQYATQLSPIIRTQCTRVYLFCSSIREGQRLSEDFGAPELEQCTELKQGEFFQAAHYTEPRVTRGRLW